MGQVENVLKYLSSLTTALASIFKRHPKIADEVAERKDIKNKRRSKKTELKNLKTDKKIQKAKKRLGKD